MLKKLCFILIGFLILTSCSSNDLNSQVSTSYQSSYSSSEERIIELNNAIINKNEEIKKLNDENNQYKEQLNNSNKPIGLSYIGYQQKYVFVGENKSILWMPDENSPIASSILQNSLVEVILAGYTTPDNIWLFVNIPVYDTPSNCYGWIKESDTQKYTKENQKLITGNIIIHKGTKGQFPDGYGEYIEDMDQQGMIEKREQGKVLVIFAGGKQVWYEEKDINFLPIE